MNKKSKLIVYLIGLVTLVVVVVGAFGYYAYKNAQTKTVVQTDPNSPSLSDTWKDQITTTANWKTHTDLKWEYQVSYPEDWELPKESYPVSDYTVEFTSSDRDSVSKAEIPGAPTYTLYITIYKNTKTNSTLEEEAKLRSIEYPQCILGEPCPTLAAKEIIKKSNSQFNQFYSVLTANNSRHTIIPLPNESEYYVDIWTWYTWPKIDYGLYNQILSTFRLIEKNKDSGKLRLCPDEWVEFLSSMMKDGFVGEQIYIEINGVLEAFDTDKFDLEWIKNNCEIKEPEPVG